MAQNQDSHWVSPSHHTQLGMQSTNNPSSQDLPFTSVHKVKNIIPKPICSFNDYLSTLKPAGFYVEQGRRAPGAPSPPRRCPRAPETCNSQGTGKLWSFKPLLYFSHSSCFERLRAAWLQRTWQHGSPCRHPGTAGTSGEERSLGTGAPLVSAPQHSICPRCRIL